jgi:hypothetical protein
MNEKPGRECVFPFRLSFTRPKWRTAPTARIDDGNLASNDDNRKAKRTQLWVGIGNTVVSLAIIVHNISLMTLRM